MSALPPIPQDVDISTQLRMWMQGMLTDAIGFDAALTVLQGNRLPRNVLINGGMQVWQRGTSFASAGAPVYTADRWEIARGGFVAGATLSRQAGPPGTQYCARLQRNAADASAAALFLAYSMETLDSVQLAGKVVTFSFMARAGANFSGGSSMAVFVRCGTGTDQNIFVGGGYTGNTDFITSSMTPTTSWAQYSFTGTVPTNCNEAGFFIDYTPSGVAGAADYIEIANVQLEIAPAFTFFDESQPFATTLAQCERYFQKSFDYATAPAQAAGISGATFYRCPVAGVSTIPTQVPFATSLRIANPTFTFFNPSAANNKWRNTSLGADSGTPSVTGNGQNNQIIINPQVAGDLVGHSLIVHWTADAEL